MRRLLITLLCLVSSPVLAAPYNATVVHAVYKKLIDANKEVKELPIYVKSDFSHECSLACTDGNEIIVTTELLLVVKNEHELAGVIGHEMAHARHRDEMKADLLGLRYAQKAGYNRCKAAQIMKLYGEDEEHPSGAVRYKNTGCK